jgi:hypothetical protein
MIKLIGGAWLKPADMAVIDGLRELAALRQRMPAWRGCWICAAGHGPAPGARRPHPGWSRTSQPDKLV